MLPEPPYVVLAEVGGGPPRARRKPPKYPSHARKSSGGACYRCLSCCCCCCLLLVFLVIVALFASFIFLDPKAPSYSVKNLSVSSFNVSDDLTLNVNISVSIRAENPNRRIGITYGKRSKAELSFRGAGLCAAVLPSFYQGHGNVTTMDIAMQGRRKLGREAQEELAEGQKGGNIPLRLHVVVPIKLRVFGYDTKAITFTVNCTLVVDSFRPNQKTRIKSATYGVNWHYA